MLRNYLTIAFRNLYKHKFFSLLNIYGLALGIAAFVFILQYISFEQSVNRFHTHLPQLYRVLLEVSYQGKTNTWAYIPPAAGPAAQREFSEVKAFCRIAPDVANGVVTYSGADSSRSLQSFSEANIAYTDGNFFELFSFPVAAGQPASLRQPYTVAISQSHARKYFGRENPLGKTLTLHNQFKTLPYTVVAVYRDFPDNSDLQYDMLFSMETLANEANLNGNGWANLNSFDGQYLHTFLQLQEKSDYRQLEQKFNAWNKKRQPDVQELVRLQPAEHMHLAASLSDYYVTSGNLGFIYLFAGIAVLILVMAWFNYVNLSTATALKRAKEVGLRKVVGASQGQLIGQFLGESLLLNGLAFVMALLIVNLLQGQFNQLIGHNLSLRTFTQSHFWLGGLALLLLGSLASGGYNAFALSSFQPIQTLKGAFGKVGKNAWLRKTLVVFQFSISIALIASTCVLFRQLQFMQNQDLGVNLEQRVVIEGPRIVEEGQYQSANAAFLNEVSQLAFVKNYCNSGVVPGRFYNFNTGGIVKLNDSRPGDEHKNYAMAIIDDRYLPTYEIGLVAGKNFSAADCALDYEKAAKVLLNERAVQELGFASAQEAVGQKIKWGQAYEVLGVVKDYHHQSLRQSIEPMIFLPRTYNGHITIQLPPTRMREQMAQLEKLYKQVFPGNPFDYAFVDEQYGAQYQSELRYGKLFTVASFLAIFIACLGLLGLTSFTVEARTKEIGIRKVLGASVQQILALLCRDFVRLVLIAFAIATPLAWWATHRWLQDFAYRAPIGWWIFALAGGIAFLIAVLTISLRALKASRANPVESLRTE